MAGISDMLEIFNRRQFRRRFGLQKVRTVTWAKIATYGFIALVVGVLLIGLLFAWYAKDLPRPDKVKRSDGLSTVVLDRNGEPLYDIYEDENRLPVNFEDIPEYLKQATVAVEDKDFYKHQGLSTFGILRAFINIVVFRNVQGGSTLTQQLVKNVLLSQERTLPRKMKEAILAIQIERKYTKDEILQMYLNEAPYGGTAVGVESASQYYFSKEVKELNLVESVILAGLPQSPSRYSPFTGEEKAYVGRAQSVLRRMREDGYISSQQETDARKGLDTVEFASPSDSLRAPHFVAYVRELLEEKFGTKMVAGGGLRVTTTLDWKLQEKAQSIVAQEVDKAKKLSVSNGAAVGIDSSTGEILLMVGSKDYSATDSGGFKFNVVTQGLRQPGSTIKPITYAAAFKKGYTPATVLMDVDTKYPSGDPAKKDYNPKNYDGKYRGPMQLRYALGNSINTIAVKVSALVGIRDVLRLAYDMGLSTLEPTDANIKRFGLSLTLGGGEVTLLELTSAFGVFGTTGVRNDPVAILKVEDSKGKVLFEHKKVNGRRVLSEDVSYVISDILSDNDARKDVFGPRSYLVIPGRTVAVKTGTTDDKRDNWTVGYVKDGPVVGAWVGNNDNTPMNPALASGTTGAAPIWNRIMSDVLKSRRNEAFVRPGNVLEMEIDGYGGGQPVDGYPKRTERFVRGTEPTGPSPIYKQIKVSKKDNNKLANAIEIAKGEFDTKTFVVFTEDDPVSSDKNRWQEGIDAWIATQTDSKFHPPTETQSDSGEQITVSIKEPGNESQVNSNDVVVRVEAGSVHQITKIEVFVDGEKKEESSDKTLQKTIHMDNGIHTIRAKATDSDGKTAETEVKIGVNQPYATPTPTA